MAENIVELNDQEIINKILETTPIMTIDEIIHSDDILNDDGYNNKYIQMNTRQGLLKQMKSTIDANISQLLPYVIVFYITGINEDKDGNINCKTKKALVHKDEYINWMQKSFDTLPKMTINDLLKISVSTDDFPVTRNTIIEKMKKIDKNVSLYDPYIRIYYVKELYRKEDGSKFSLESCLIHKDEID